jgi:hypothetical protein
MLPVELSKPNCKSSSLPVDRKYQKGQSRDNIEQVQDKTNLEDNKNEKLVTRQESYS